MHTAFTPLPPPLLSPPPPSAAMLSVSLFCLPCVVLPAILLALQFVYNRVGFIKAAVHYFFPSLAAAEARAAQDAEKAAEEAAAKRKAFFAANNDEGVSNSSAAVDKDKEGVNQRKVAPATDEADGESKPVAADEPKKEL